MVSQHKRNTVKNLGMKAHLLNIGGIEKMSITDNLNGNDISPELLKKIKDEWAKLKIWQKIPNRKNLTLFKSRLKLTDEEEKEFMNCFNF